MTRVLIKILFSLMLLVPQLAQAKTIYALVIGVDRYQFIPDLDGAVNDAMDISDALQSIDAEVITLLNEHATRANIMSAWRGLANRMQPDDTLVVSYAGHGSNEPEHQLGSEEDGRDETFLLAGFSPYGAAAGERIRDDEIAELLGLTSTSQVIFVADACHAGTVSRNIRPVLGYRYVSHGKISNDPLPPPPPNTKPYDGQDGIALFLAAVSDSDKVPEFLIDGQPRGALSYSFARGLRGEADLDQDNNLSKGEIETYVRRSVRGISQGIQTPQIHHAGAGDEILFTLAAPTGISQPLQVSLFNIPFDELPPVPLAWATGVKQSDTELNGVTFLDNPQTAAMIVDADNKLVRTSAGDAIAVLRTVEHLQAVVNKFRLTSALDSIVTRDAFEIRFADGDRKYRSDDVLTVLINGRTTRHITLFNIGSDGEISFLYPIQNAAANLSDPIEVDAANKLNLSLMIAPPFGADHVIAVETDTAPTVMRRVLSSYDGSRDVRAFWNQFRKVAGDMDTDPRLSIFPFHTAAR